MHCPPDTLAIIRSFNFIFRKRNIEMSHNRAQTYNERSSTAGRNSPSPTKRKRFLSLPGLNVVKPNKSQWSEQVASLCTAIIKYDII